MRGGTGEPARTRRWVPLAAAVVAAFGVFAPQALAVGKIEGIGAQPLADIDNRTGLVEPSAVQRQVVNNLNARVTWNRFGTPHTLIKKSGFLATGVAGSTAEAAARAWLTSRSSLFRMTAGDVAKLVLHNDSKLANSQGHAVTFRQKYGQLDAWPDGIVTVGLTGTPATGWKIAFVQSTLTGVGGLTGNMNLSLKQGWSAAAANVGSPVASVVNVGNQLGVQGGYAVFAVNGLAEQQFSRPLAFVTPSGVVPAIESLVLTDPAKGGVLANGHAGTYSVIVDGRNGNVLMRTNLTHNLAGEAQALAAPETFSGDLGIADGACGQHPLAVGSDVKSVDVAATADNPANDIVLDLLKDGNVVAHSDTGTSPEAVHYAPAGNVVPGAYVIRVCEFGDGTGALPPTTYHGTVVQNTVANVNPAPYPPLWRVFPSTPLPAQLTQEPWNVPSTDIRKLWCWEKDFNGGTVANCDEEVKNLAARAPWDVDPATGQPTFTTLGNNARDSEAWNDPLGPGPFGHTPFAADRNYSFEWSNDWYTSDCSPTQFQPHVGNDISASVTNLFAMHNRMHDWSYSLGFTEENWNMQQSNFGNLAPPPAGLPGAPSNGNDPVLGQSQAGAMNGGSPNFLGRDNANMRSLPDGVSPITNMYLWQPIAGTFYPPCLDGDYDMPVIGHEYGHAIENRMIGKGGNRSGHHAGAMGESNGDLNGMEVVNEYGYVPVAGENRYAVGIYATGDTLRGIRNFAMNFPYSGAVPTPSTNPLVDPLNFSDMGYDSTGPQVHADGEIWSKVNFDIRQALSDKHRRKFPPNDAALQKRCARGELPADKCPGNRRWIQIVYDAYLLMPIAPTMLQARDAYLAADLMRANDPSLTWPSNQKELWLEFARHGFGEGAFSTNGPGTATATSDLGDRDPIPDFASPEQSEATVTFQADAGDTHTPVNARIYVGWYEARVSPIADTDGSTPAAAPPAGAAENLDNVATFVPGTYEFIANAPGYGHRRFRLKLNAGDSRTVLISFPTNLASKFQGAVATGDGVRHDQLIDDTEATNWERVGATPDVSGSQVTVDLAGTAPQKITHAQVSAMLIGQNRFTALRQFALSTCIAAPANVNCTAPGSFTTIYTSPADFFPGSTPRPISPELLLRAFDLPRQPNGSPYQATHVRITVLTNQCTGNPAYQDPGDPATTDQDADPANETDCRLGQAPFGVPPDQPLGTAPRDNDVRIAELQVFNGVYGIGTPGAPAPQDPVVVLTKSGPLTATKGTNITYTLGYTNVGPAAASNSRLVDTLPEGVKFVRASDGGTFAQGKVTWNLGSVAANTSGSRTVTVKVNADLGSVLVNTADYTADLTVATPAAATTIVVP